MNHFSVLLMLLTQISMGILHSLEAKLIIQIILSVGIASQIILILLIYNKFNKTEIILLLISLQDVIYTISFIDHQVYILFQCVIGFQLLQEFPINYNQSLSLSFYLGIIPYQIAHIVPLTLLSSFSEDNDLPIALVVCAVMICNKWKSMIKKQEKSIICTSQLKEEHTIMSYMQHNLAKEIKQQDCQFVEKYCDSIQVYNIQGKSLILSSDLEFKYIGEDIAEILITLEMNPCDFLESLKIERVEKKFENLTNFNRGSTLKDLINLVKLYAKDVVILKTNIIKLDLYLIIISHTQSYLKLNFIYAEEYVHYIKQQTTYQLMKRLYDSFSHEFGTILNQIVLQIQIGMSQYSQLSHFFEDMLNCCKIMQNLIKDLQDFHQVGAKSFQFEIGHFQVEDLLVELHQTYKQFLKEKQLKLTIQNKVTRQFCSDKQRIKQILFNLLSNSIKFTPKGGVIKIKIEELNENVLQFSISDNGIGISQDTQQQLKQYFKGNIDSNRRLSENVAGLGLGLMNSNQLIIQLSKKSHCKGGLQFISTENVGTKFWFIIAQSEFPEDENRLRAISRIDKNTFYIKSTLQFQKSRTQDIPKFNIFSNQFEFAQKSNENLTEHDQTSFRIQFTQQLVPKLIPQQCSCYTILLVDDEMFNLVPLQIIIKIMGRDVEIANSGFEAIKMVEEKPLKCPSILQKCQYRLILMDINMPQMDGLNCAKQILSKYNSISIVACTAFNDTQTRFQAEEVGMVDFLEKPIIRTNLQEILNLYS